MRPQDHERYYVYQGRIPPVKKIGHQLFPTGKPVAVWDRKMHILIRKLPYIREATAEEIAAAKGVVLEKAQAQVAAKPKEDRKAQLQAELTALGIGFDKRWGVDKLEEQKALATRPVEPQMREEEIVTHGDGSWEVLRASNG